MMAAYFSLKDADTGLLETGKSKTRSQDTGEKYLAPV